MAAKKMEKLVENETYDLPDDPVKKYTFFNEQTGILETITVTATTLEDTKVISEEQKYASNIAVLKSCTQAIKTFLESEMLEEKTEKILSKYSHNSDLKTVAIVGAIGRFREAEIMENHEDNEHVKIHYPGFRKEYDQWINKRDDRFFPSLPSGCSFGDLYTNAYMVSHFDGHKSDWGITFDLEGDWKSWGVSNVDLGSQAEQVGAQKHLKIVAVDGIWINDLNWKKSKKLLEDRHLEFITFKDDNILATEKFERKKGISSSKKSKNKLLLICKDHAIREGTIVFKNDEYYKVECLIGGTKHAELIPKESARLIWNMDAVVKYEKVRAIAIDVKAHKEENWGIKISAMGDKIIIEDVAEELQFANKGARGGMEIICINSIGVNKENLRIIKKILKRTPACKMVLRANSLFSFEQFLDHK